MTTILRVLPPVLVLLAGLIAAPAAAQPSREECSARLERARGQYHEQQFAEVERLITSCVDRLLLPATEMDEGFRLLSLAFLRENLLADAQATVIKHLAWSFTYEPDEIRDPPLYVALVRVTRAQLTVPPGALVASAGPTGAPATAAAQPAQTGSPEVLQPTAAPGTASQPPQPGNLATEPPQTSTDAAGTATESGEMAISAAEPAIEPAEGTTAPAETATEPAERAAEPAEPATEPATTGLETERAAAIPQTPAGTRVASDRPATFIPPPADSRLLRRPPDAAPAPREDDGVGLNEPATVAEVSSARYAGGLAAVPGTTPAGVGLLGADPAGLSEPLDFATVMPEIVGGHDAIRLEYPDFERRAGIEGRVVVQFVVGEDGALSGAEVLRGVGPGLDAAALAALRRLSFTPGRQNGEPVPVRMTLSFDFRAGGRN